MRVLLICDRSFAQREHALLRRLAVGLIDEGVRVVQAAPEGMAHLIRGAMTPTFEFSDLGPSITRRIRSSALVRQLRAADDAYGTADNEALFDVVHAWGEECWSFALDAASAAGASLVLEAWSGAALDRIGSLERSALRAGGDLPGLWLAPDHTTLRAIDSRSPRWARRVAPWGVHMPKDPPPHSRANGPTTIGIVARRDADAGIMTELLNALHEVIRQGHDVLVFADHGVFESHGALWRHADRIGLLSAMSTLECLEAQRDLLLRADVLIAPDPAGEHRSVVLEAMARGMSVITQADPLIEYTIDGRTAVLVEAPTRAGWFAGLRRVLDDEPFRRGLAESARSYIGAHRLAHAHVRAVLEAYSAVSDQPLAFRAT